MSIYKLNHIILLLNTYGKCDEKSDCRYVVEKWLHPVTFIYDTNFKFWLHTILLSLIHFYILVKTITVAPPYVGHRLRRFLQLDAAPSVQYSVNLHLQLDYKLYRTKVQLKRY